MKINRPLTCPKLFFGSLLVFSGTALAEAQRIHCADGGLFDQLYDKPSPAK